MATPFPVKPEPIFIVVQAGGRFTQGWADYFTKLDQLLRPVSTVALMTPNNANAAAANVPLGGFYTDQADPAKVYIRTV